MIYWVLAWRTFHRLRQHDCLGLASEAAFNAVLSLVPGFICLIAITSTLGLSDTTVTFVISRLVGLLPNGSQPVVDVVVRAAVENPAPGLLTGRLVPERRSELERRPLRILSAGCSSGEEAYSIVISLQNAGFELTGPAWEVDVGPSRGGTIAT